MSTVCSLVRVSEALDILVRHNRINSEMASQVMTFLRAHPAQIPMSKNETDKRTSKINEVSVKVIGIDKAISCVKQLHASPHGR